MGDAIEETVSRAWVGGAMRIGTPAAADTRTVGRVGAAARRGEQDRTTDGSTDARSCGRGEM